MKTLGYVLGGTGRMRPFDQVFDAGVEVVSPREIEESNPNALVIWGGADIAPKIYGEEGGKWTYANDLSFRDKTEVAACQAAIARGIPIIGVCRGAQLLCALAGGKLVQHVDGHNQGDHAISTNDGRTITTSSVHHQMMWPYDVKHDLLAWSKSPKSHIYAFNDKKVRTSIEYPEPEVVWFPEIKGLAIQGHPEFMNDQCEFVQYCMELVRKYIV